MPSLLFAFVFAVHRAHAPEQGAHFILFVHVRSVGPCDKGHMAMVHNIILQYYDPLDTYSGLARVRTDKNRPFLCIKSGRFSTASMSVLYRITVGWIGSMRISHALKVFDFVKERFVGGLERGNVRILQTLCLNEKNTPEYLRLEIGNDRILPAIWPICKNIFVLQIGSEWARNAIWLYGKKKCRFQIRRMRFNMHFDFMKERFVVWKEAMW